MEREKIKSIIESLLFVSGEPVKISSLAKIIGVSVDQSEKAVKELQKELKEKKRGIHIIVQEKSVQAVSAPENGSFVEKIIKEEENSSLSAAALETLAIVAYRGPLSRAEIESFRGVNSAFVLRNLALRGLVEKEENSFGGRGYLYKASFDFLKKLGLGSIEELPEYAIMAQNDKNKKKNNFSE